MRALQSADVILFDDLVSDDVLELARREAKRLMVGKRGGRASCAQEDINDLMTRLALQGKQVVRLKSGDPMIFGRAGEEIEHLEKAGIPVDVVPGITAGIALASALGVSLTHRDMAQSVRFVTGCAKTGQLPSGLDWQGLADPNTTTIFYMAGGTAGRHRRATHRSRKFPDPACRDGVERVARRRTLGRLHRGSRLGQRAARSDEAGHHWCGPGLRKSKPVEHQA